MVAQDNTASNQFAANTSKDRQTGHDKVDAISRLQLLGDITPRSWYKHICYTTKTGDTKVDRLAIDILSDIIYWYRAYEIRNEITSFHEGWGKKFKEDMLRRSTEDFAQSLNATARTVRESIKVLESLGLIQVVYKPLKTDFGVIPNIMYIDVFPDAIASITYPVTKNNDSSNVNAETLEKSLSTKWSISSDEMRNALSTKSSISNYETVGITIYRENSSENTTEREDARAREVHPPLKTLEDFSNNQNAAVPEVKNNQQGLNDQEDPSKQQDVVTPQSSNKQDLKGHGDTSNSTEVKVVEDCNKIEDSEVPQNPNTVEVQVVEDSSTTGEGFRVPGNNQIPHEGKLAPGVFDKPEQKNKYKLTSSVEDFINRYEETGKIPNYGTEFKQWAMDEIGEVVKKYRKSGEILKGKPNDIDTSFLKHIAASSNKKGKPADFDIHNAFNWVVNAEKDPIRWQELTLLVTAWELSKITGKDNLNVVEEIENSGRMRVRRKLNIN